MSNSNAGYSHDSEAKTFNPQWMRLIPNDIRVSELSLPGSHDTMAFYGGDSTQCQTMSLENQLQSGIRVLDIRCRHIEDVFAIHHGIVFQKVFFGDVLNIVKSFLEKNPSESVLMRVKEEHTPEKTTRSFESTFQEHYWDAYQDDCWLPDSDNPTLGEIRGKIVILQNFPAAQKFGIDYGTFVTQDQYHLKTNWDLYKKWEAVKGHLALANQGDKDTKYMNYLSGSGGSFPYFVASGHSSPGTSAPRLVTGKTTPGWRNDWLDFPRIKCFIGICTIAFEGTNILSTNRIGNVFKNRVGTVMADFPGPGLIKQILACNEKFIDRSEIRHQIHPNYCLNLHRNEAKDGGVINLWFVNGHKSQQWELRADGTIRHQAHPNYCLNLHHNEAKDGGVINLWSVNGHESQRWELRADGTIRHQAHPNYCLNLHGNEAKDGGVINLWSVNGHESQRWES